MPRFLLTLPLRALSWAIGTVDAALPEWLPPAPSWVNGLALRALEAAERFGPTSAEVERGQVFARALRELPLDG